MIQMLMWIIMIVSKMNLSAIFSFFFFFSKLIQHFIFSLLKGMLNYKTFIDKELVLFSRADCERSIPSVIDGLKPGKQIELWF